MEKKKDLLIYETPSLQISCLPADVLTASTDVGEEYPDVWN